MTAPRKRLRDRFLPGLISLLGPLLIKTLGGTWRFRRVGLHPHRARLEGTKGRYIVAFWHNTLLPLTYLHRGEGAAVLVSRHGDGELIARILLGLGFEVARGSSTRGGARAALELIRFAESKTADIGITPDGPKGPARIAHEGVVFLASRSGFPILPLVAVPERAWQLRSWDRFMIPQPFSRIAIAAGEPIVVPRELEREHIAQYQRAFENEMSRAESEARRLLKEDW